MCLSAFFALAGLSQYLCMSEIDIFSQSCELAHLMKSNPKAIDRHILKNGSEIIALFRDPNFVGNQIAGRKAQEKDLLKFAIEDVSMGAVSLSHNQLGLVYRDRKVQTFLTPLGTTTSGNVIMSITLKKRSAFKKYRSDELHMELEQQEVDAALYYLTFLLSEVIG